MKRIPAINLLIVFVITVTTTLVAIGAKPGDWPQWRGLNRDGHSSETGLLKEWPEDGPPVVWKIDNVGVGYATVSVADGRVMTQGDLDGIEHIIAVSEKDGALLWAVQPDPARQALQDRVDAQFKRFDKDGNDRLDQVEALNGLNQGVFQADSAEDGDKTEIAAKRTTEFFEAFDKDTDGNLTAMEIHRAMLREFWRIDRPDDDADADALAAKRTKDAIKQADKNEDSKVDRRESRNGILGSLFNSIDQRDPNTNRGDGFLTEEEIQSFFATRQKGLDGLVTKADLQQYFEKRFPNKDGILSKQDVTRFYGGFRNGSGDGPRGTPTIEGDRVYAVGGYGDLTCLEAATGKTIWHVHLANDLQGRRGGWGYCESPLIDGENLIVTPGGGKGTLAALNKMTGEVVWRSSDVKDGAHYSSAIAVDIEGTHQIIQFTRSRIVGVDAITGNLLWDYARSANGTANCSTPVHADGYVFSASAYGTGGGMVKVTRDGDNFTAEEVYFEKKMQNHHGGMVLVGDYLYGFGSGSLMCLNFKTGEMAWQAGSVRKGSLCYADGDLYCLSERNQFALATANSEEYIEKGRFNLPRSGRPTWAHPVVANGQLYVRDQNSLTCYDVRAEKSP